MYSEDAINYQVAEEPVEGRNAIREMFVEVFSRATMKSIVENIFEDGEWAIGMAGSAWPQGMRFFYVINDRIVFQRRYWDKLAFLM